MLFSPFHGWLHSRRRRSDRSKHSSHTHHRYRRLGFQRLERRELLSAVSLYDSADFTTLASLSTSTNTGEKPQSKVWEYADHWWSVLPNSSGTWLWRLDGRTWDPMLKLSTKTGVQADVKAAGDLTHVLLYSGTASQFVTLQYSAAATSYTLWAVQPSTVNVALSSGVETATIDVDGAGRLWLASDASSTVQVRYSDYPYKSFSSPITIASGISSDDISAIAALPNGAVGVFWSNQNADRFGFRLHLEGDSPTAWSANEVPASQSARSVGGGMADDHLNLAVASDGTLYAAVKTSYDSGGYPKIALLIRRPDGTWRSLYNVSNSGTRPIVVLNEQANRLIVAYTKSESGGNILFRESPMDSICFGPVHTLISGSVNNVTSVKDSVSDDLVVLAGGGSKVYGSLLQWPGLVDPPGAPPPEFTITSFRDGLNGYYGTRDASILISSADTNYGKATQLQANGSSDAASLIRWDLSSITLGSQIQSATITLNVTDTTTQAYEIYELKRAWFEHQTTWNQAATGTAWQMAGAQGAEDRGSTVLGTVTASSKGTMKIVLNTAGLEVLQRWINQPESNYGLIIQDYAGGADGVIFSSSEAVPASLRPTLSISYLPQQAILSMASSESDPEPQPLPLSIPPPAGNQPPQVDAGADQQIELPAAAVLSGKVQDDGLPSPPAAITVRWSKSSGPGTVEFADSTAAQTTATFSQPGSYVLRLTADDGQQAASDDLTIVVSSPPVVSSGLVGSWQFDETAGTKVADASGLGNNGTAQGGPARVTGRSGTALSLDGKDDRVVVPDSPSLDIRDAITISAWLRPGKTATQYVVKKADHGAIDGYELSLSSNGTVFVRFNNASSGNKYRVDSTTHYPTNGSTWIHVAATYDGTTIKLYINGKLEGSLAASFKIGTNSLGLGIGAEANGYRPMKGPIDDVRIYARALSAAEIAELARV